LVQYPSLAGAGSPFIDMEIPFVKNSYPNPQKKKLGNYDSQIPAGSEEVTCNRVLDLRHIAAFG